MIELVRDLRVINVLAKFENDPWKIMDVRVLTGLVCPAARLPARPLGVRQYPGALKGCGVKIAQLDDNSSLNSNIVIMMHKPSKGVEEMSYCFSRSFFKFLSHTGQKITNLALISAFLDENSIINSQMAMKLCKKLWGP